MISSWLSQEDEEADMDLDDKVEYKQWLHTDRTTLTDASLSVGDFVEQVYLC